MMIYTHFLSDVFTMAEKYSRPTNHLAEESEYDDMEICNVNECDETAVHLGSNFVRFGNGNGNGSYGILSLQDNSNIININNNLVTTVSPHDVPAWLYEVEKHLKALKDASGNSDITFLEIRRNAQQIKDQLYQILNTFDHSSTINEERQGRMSCPNNVYINSLLLSLETIFSLLDRGYPRELSFEDIEEVIRNDVERNSNRDNSTATPGTHTHQENSLPTVKVTPSTPLSVLHSQDQVLPVVMVESPSREDYRKVLNSSHSGRTKQGTIALHMVPREACDTEEEWRRVKKAKNSKDWRDKIRNERMNGRQDPANERLDDGEWFA